jgi:hypothetical protein
MLNAFLPQLASALQLALQAGQDGGEARAEDMQAA